MSTSPVRQTFFSGGQVDEINWKRTDINDYLTCAQLLLNCEVGTTGLAKKRKGTRFDIPLNGGGYGQAEPNSQLYEFVDKFLNYYIIMSANTVMYIYSINNDGVVTLYQTLTGLPYTSVDLPNIDYSLTNDSLVLTHLSYPPARIYILNYSGGSGDGATFAYAPIPVYPIPPLDFGLINYSAFAVSASVTSGVLTFQFTGLSGDPGFTSAWVGGIIIGLGASVTSPLGSALITAVSYSSGVTTFTAIVTNPFTANFPIVGSQYSIQQPSWSALLGYPSKCLFYQNRLWFANTPSLPSTVFGSKINAPANFDVGVGLDSDAIVYTIGQSDAGGIQWMNGGKQLEIYTLNFEFAAPQEQNIGLTPSTFSIRQQSSYGSSGGMKPITYLNDSYFITRSGNSLMNFHFDGIGQTYTASNISALAESLVNNPINRALMRGSSSTQDNFIYIVNQDNTVTTFQFLYAAKLAALTQTQFLLDDNGDPTAQVIDITSVNNVIYLLKYYPTPNVYALEEFNDAQWLDGWINATMLNTGVISGLSQFEGLTVNVVYNNQDFGQYLVVGGQITCEFPQVGAVGVQVGLIYPWQVNTMYLFGGANQSNFYKQITRIFVDYYHTIGLYVNDTLVNYQNYADIMAGLPIQYKTDTAVIDSFEGWNRFDNITLSQMLPFDCQITAIMYQIDETIV